MELRIGSVILAHPDVNVAIHECLLLRIEKITHEQVIAVPVDGSDGFMIIPVDHIRACGKEENLRKEEHEKIGDNTKQNSEDHWENYSH